MLAEILNFQGTNSILGMGSLSNHVYVNPVDMTVRSYWASDIINKLVYPTVPALLENECPELYANYLKLIEGEKSNPLAVKQTKNEVALLPQEYLETDIYKASREIIKMQKLNSNVLTTWYDNIPDKNAVAVHRQGKTFPDGQK